LSTVSSRRKPLLEWMDQGDPELTPILMADALSTTASYLGISTRTDGESTSFTNPRKSAITPEMIVSCSREIGAHFHWSLGSATPFDAIEFLDDVSLEAREESDERGDIRRFTTIRTPAGTVSEVFLTPADAPGCWLEHLIKTEEDLPVLAFLVEKSAQASIENDRVREKLTAKFRAEAADWPDSTPFYAIIGIPAFCLTSNLFVDPTTAFYLMEDHNVVMERLFEAYEQANAVWVECAATAGADFALGAINGLELYSPSIYQKYFIPQARRLREMANKAGMLHWVHTCGRMSQLVNAGVYGDMGVNVLESLSAPPIGDVEDIGASRARLGKAIVTRGGVNVDLFYETDIEVIRRRTREVLESTRGYRHMIGDTNDSYPPYPRENILALVDEVYASGRALPAAHTDP